MLICICNVGKGLKIWQQNCICVRDEPFAMSLMKCHNDKPFMRTALCTSSAAHSHNLTATDS